jgi:hypothetical protein
MEELKQLVLMVADLPNAALWVAGGFLAWKLSTLLSIYATIRFVFGKAIDAYVRAKEIKAAPPVVTPLKYDFKGVAISEEVAMALSAQVIRISKTGFYIHMADVHSLSKAIDTLLEKKDI